MLVDPDASPEETIARQRRIIEALMRRASRQTEVGPSAYEAFRSAIELKRKVAAQSRDLQRAETELESARHERLRTRRNLVEALSSMEEGFALFAGGRLDLCNDLFRTLLPDIAGRVTDGLSLPQFLLLVSSSAHFVGADRSIQRLCETISQAGPDAAPVSVQVQLTDDRWYQMRIQHMASENTVILWTEISALVRRNRLEKESLIDQQADYLRAVFQNMTAGVCTFSADGTLKMQNGRFREMLGLPASSLAPGVPMQRVLVSMQTRRILSAEDASDLIASRKELRRSGRLRRRVRHAGERVLDVQASRLPSGGFLIEVTDVTLEARTTDMLEKCVAERTAELTYTNEQLTREYQEKACVEEELRRAKERAEAAVSSKTRFLAAASHDLLQPINAAKLLISVLKESARDTALAGTVDRLEGSFNSAEQLLRLLLDLSRLESADPDTVQPTAVRLSELMENVHADQSVVAERKRVTLDVVPCGLVVRSDPVYLLRSVQNLVVNAIQYTPPGGRVLMGCRRRGGRVVLEVWDTGVGIAPGDQARIFEEFARADTGSVTTGMGLGLSVVDRACRLLDHDLSVQSAPHRGSVFRIGMEVLGSDGPSGATARATPPPDHVLEDLIALVIENDPDVLFGTTRWLEHWGASVLPARGPEEAAAFLNDTGVAPDVILADYQLDRDTTGLSAIAEIRKRCATQIPAILITANRECALREQARRLDISLMTKPVKPSRLRALIDGKVRGRSV